jgi:hypothetical protein
MRQSTHAREQAPPEGSVTDSRPATPPSSVVRSVVTWLAIGSVCLNVALFGIPLFVALWQQQPWIMQIVASHFAAIVGLPAGALLAFLLVVILEARFDRVEMEFGGLVRFRGASGPIVLWVLCFLAITMATKLLW